VGTILRGRNHRVQTARDTREARALLEKHEFDLVVADLQVSDGVNGESLGEWLTQQKPALAHRMVWMCAGTASRSAGEKSAVNGCQILQKPFKASELLSAVDGLLLGNTTVAPIER
jgi:DNA-binding NtrC family response regulator